MMRHLKLTLICLMAGLLNSQAEVLLNIQVPESKLLELDETYTLDLTDFFQVFPSPGPVAEFTLRMPVQTGFQELLYKTTGNKVPDYDPEGATRELMTYQLAGGGSYAHQYDPAASAQNFVWQEYLVNFQLLAESAPATVGNFIQYVNENALDNTIVHRSEIGVIQLGRYRISDLEDKLLAVINGYGPIEFEETIPNSQGTLAMARGSSANSAQSEFYINLVDNSETLKTNYSVFGELLNFETSMPILEEMGDPFVYEIVDLKDLSGNVIFPTTPLYSPFWQEKDSWLRVKDISIPAGDSSGITYSYEFSDLDGEEGTSDEEAAYQAAFDISINNGVLQVSRDTSGIALLVVKGTFADQEKTFRIAFTGYDQLALEAFPGSTIRTEGYLESSWYGRMLAETYPKVIHENLGEQYVYYTVNNITGVYSYYIFDNELDSWTYTTPGVFPLIYVFNTGHWMDYVVTTGGSDENPRWYWNYNLQEWVVMQ